MSLAASSAAPRRERVRRLCRRLPQAKIFVGFWQLPAEEAETALAGTRADLVVTSLRQAVEQTLNSKKEAASAEFGGELGASALPLAVASL
jgi:hypothetical protein